MSDSDVVIRVEGLGKMYSLHHEQGERYTALRDVVARQAKAVGRLLNPFTLAGQLRKAQREAAVERAESEEEFWALKDVSFEIRRGERVGIIGRNGAGKSTLLKILSRITEPTTGRVEIRGRVASLLEVGTGFHPELTGRENIYLNGAILGMTRREIRSKFDEIVDFAEVEKFLDTPVKRYSSGMYVRLAFAVAAHLEPEILVVDEVLAVGDASFQKKCLGKMEDVADREGRTVLFVSHQMTAIKTLCEKAIVIKLGRVDFAGHTEEAIERYFAQEDQKPSSNLMILKRKPQLANAFKFAHFQLNLEDNGGLTLDIKAIVDLSSSAECLISIGFCSLNGELLFNCPVYWNPTGTHEHMTILSMPRDLNLCLHFSRVPLAEGSYSLNFFCEQNSSVLDHLSQAAWIQIPPAAPNSSGLKAMANIRRKSVLVEYKWSYS